MPVILLLVLRNLEFIRAGLSPSKKLLALSLLVLVVAAFVLFPTISALSYPVVINLMMLVWFAQSLRAGQVPLVERIARIKEPELEEKGVHYTRQVTKLWCIVFALTAAVSAYTVVLGDRDIWLLFNGLIIYLFVAGTFVLEFLFRTWYRRT
ncbi:putative membrane protein [Umboniibacter marinipuniceus]|uniref:Putative membrane protein n=1 Tax=Umboniibacter marinipuniceus TaxID=569599 RepID=A0A3M0AD70_9GAMM|nr:putative membrane protein [Umboniibacter marinipuniceus]